MATFSARWIYGDDRTNNPQVLQEVKQETLMAKDEIKKETGLSTKLAADYHIKEEPKGVKLEIDRWYTLSDGAYGTREVKIVSMRKLGDEIVIYYKWKKESNFTFSLSETYQYSQSTLSTFKMQLLDYGKITSLDLIYPIEGGTQ